mgnify:CR=1 FL=1
MLKAHKGEGVRVRLVAGMDREAQAKMGDVRGMAAVVVVGREKVKEVDGTLAGGRGRINLDSRVP